MMKKTEDDTFRYLWRSPFDVVKRALKERNWLIDDPIKIMAKHGWRNFEYEREDIIRKNNAAGR